MPCLLVPLLGSLNNGRGHLPPVPVKAVLQALLEPGRRQPVSQELFIKAGL